MHYIEVENLTFYYDDEPVLEDVSYYVDPGEFVILTGENGAAKSTLIKSTLGLLKPTSGKITVAKKNSAGEKISIGYIPQQVASFNAGFPSTVIRISTFRSFSQKSLVQTVDEKKIIFMWKKL